MYIYNSVFMAVFGLNASFISFIIRQIHREDTRETNVSVLRAEIQVTCAVQHENLVTWAACCYAVMAVDEKNSLNGQLTQHVSIS